ncbi:hypothetical protein AQY21_18165 [Paracoccus sp. MKU1]|nr:hypothetical protein AQY21_18165 [Paracoccus sp. MKU1]
MPPAEAGGYARPEGVKASRLPAPGGMSVPPARLSAFLRRSLHIVPSCPIIRGDDGRNLGERAGFVSPT